MDPIRFDDRVAVVTAAGGGLTAANCDSVATPEATVPSVEEVRERVGEIRSTDGFTISFQAAEV